MALTVQQVAAKQAAYQKQLAAATTQAEFDKIFAAAKGEGIKLDPAVVSSAQKAISVAEAAKMKTAGQAFLDKQIADKAAAAKAATDKALADLSLIHI